MEARAGAETAREIQLGREKLGKGQLERGQLHREWTAGEGIVFRQVLVKGEAPKNRSVDRVSLSDPGFKRIFF